MSAQVSVQTTVADTKRSQHVSVRAASSHLSDRADVVRCVAGLNLAQQCRLHYSRPTSLALWFLTEIAIIGSDIQEIVGTAIAFKILFRFPLWVGALLTALDTFTFLGLHYFGIRKLEAFVCALIFTMSGCFAVNFVQAGPSAGELARGTAMPGLPSYGLNIALGTVGAVIMPHNIYLHSALVQSRNVDRSSPRKVAEANKYNAIESAVALFVSFWINLFVVGAYASAFFNPLCAAVEKVCTYAAHTDCSRRTWYSLTTHTLSD